MENIKYGRKKNGIKAQLVKKVNEWLDTIDDPVVQNLASLNTIVTGGSIASMLLGEEVNDYDVYFRDKVTTLAVANYYVDKFNKAQSLKVGDSVNSCSPEVKEDILENAKGEEEERVIIWMQSSGVAGENQEKYEYFEGQPPEETQKFAESLSKDVSDSDLKPSHRPVFLSANAITLSDKFQLVIRFYGEPSQIHDNYDFVHAMNYYDHGTKALVLKPEALECLLSRTLVYAGSLYPIASVFRTKKFIERGWRIAAGQQLKIMWQISELNLKDLNVLKEQLTGVDIAYMHQLVQALSDVEPEKINSTYVAEIIDQIFD
jgi:hypothetical protein